MPYYPRSDIQRFNVQEDLIPWEREYKQYKPPYYLAPVVARKPIWADPESTEYIA